MSNPPPIFAGTSGHVVGYLDGANTFSAVQTFGAGIAGTTFNGTGTAQLGTSGSNVFLGAAQTSPTTNGIEIMSAAAGQRPTIQFYGIDATRGAQIFSQGTGTIILGSGTNNGAVGSLQVLDPGGTAVNPVQVTAGTSGNPAQISSPSTIKFMTGVSFLNTVFTNIGALNLSSGTLTFVGAQGASQYSIFQNAAAGGSATSPVNVQSMTLQDNAALSTGNALSYQFLNMNSGAGFTGNRATRQAILNINGTSGVVATDSDRQWQADILTAQISANQGGTSPHSGLSAGFVYSGGDQLWARSGATNLSGLTGREIDVGIFSGASSASRRGLSVVSYGANQGQDIDLAVGVSRTIDPTIGTAPGWKIAYGLSGPSTPFPVDAGGAIFQYVAPISIVSGHSDVPPIAALGFDISGINFTTAAFRSPGNFAVEGIGAIDSGSARLSTSGNTVSLDAPGAQLNTATLVGGGSQYVVGDQVFDRATGTIITINSVNGSGSILTFSVTVKGAISAAGSPPANPVSFIGGTGNSASFNLTWTAATTLALNPSGSVKFAGAASSSANGSVATVLGSVGPAGAHTTVQEWLTVILPSGNTRYIACF